MASMGDVPDVTRNKMSLCSCHKLQNNAFFALKKVNIALFSRKSLIVFHEISFTYRGPTPILQFSLKVERMLHGISDHSFTILQAPGSEEMGSYTNSL